MPSATPSVPPARRRYQRAKAAHRAAAALASAPVNSRGLPFAAGDRWSCSDCGMSGDDTSHAPHPLCPKTRTGAHLSIVYVTRGETWRPVRGAAS